MPSDGMPACHARRLQMLRGFMLKVRLCMYLTRNIFYNGMTQDQAFKSKTITPVACYLDVEFRGKRPHHAAFFFFEVFKKRLH